MDYKSKYFKYKRKYLTLLGGASEPMKSLHLILPKVLAAHINLDEYETHTFGRNPETFFKNLFEYENEYENICTYINSFYYMVELADKTDTFITEYDLINTYCVNITELNQADLTYQHNDMFILVKKFGAHGIVFNKNGDLFSNDNIITTIKQSEKQFCIIPLSLPSHQNMLIFDTYKKTINRFDSGICMWSLSDNFDNKLKDYFSIKLADYQYINAFEISLVDVGPQTLARDENCYYWSLLFAVLKILNPQLESCDIVNYMTIDSHELINYFLKVYFFIMNKYWK